MTKKELKWQIDDQQDQINELWKRIAILENEKYPIELRDDGYEMHNKACSYGLSDIGGEGCICNR